MLTYATPLYIQVFFHARPGPALSLIHTPVTRLIDVWLLEPSVLSAVQCSAVVPCYNESDGRVALAKLASTVTLSVSLWHFCISLLTATVGDSLDLASYRGDEIPITKITLVNRLLHEIKELTSPYNMPQV